MTSLRAALLKTRHSVDSRTETAFVHVLLLVMRHGIQRSFFSFLNTTPNVDAREVEVAFFNIRQEVKHDIL